MRKMLFIHFLLLPHKLLLITKRDNSRFTMETPGKYLLKGVAKPQHQGQ